ncbi:hypothetical protein ACRS64_26975 [Pseudomonas aeruginosa]|uniref:hypothetical protein n=1 Tax=Pseudomonas aeruginosa TaxID=287 RepID=UPI003DA76668
MKLTPTLPDPQPLMRSTDLADAACAPVGSTYLDVHVAVSSGSTTWATGAGRHRVLLLEQDAPGGGGASGENGLVDTRPKIGTLLGFAQRGAGALRRCEAGDPGTRGVLRARDIYVLQQCRAGCGPPPRQAPRRLERYPRRLRTARRRLEGLDASEVAMPDVCRCIFAGVFERSNAISNQPCWQGAAAALGAIHERCGVA